MSDCNQFNNTYIQHLLGLNNVASKCSTGDSQVSLWVNVSKVCSENSKWHVPPQCSALREQYNQEDCRRIQLYEDCRRKVEAKPPASLEGWKVPGDAVTAAQRLNSFLNDPGLPVKSPWARATAGIATPYSHIQSGLVALSGNSDLGERLSALSSEMSDLVLSNNDLARELLDQAVAGTIQLNTEALNALINELDQFSTAYTAEMKMKISKANSALKSASATKRRERIREETAAAERARQQQNERQQEQIEQQQERQEVPSDPNDWIYQTYTDRGVRVIQGCVIRGLGCNSCIGGSMQSNGVLTGGENCDTPQGLRQAIEICTPVCGLNDHLR